MDPAQSSFNAGKDAHVHGHRKPGEELVFRCALFARAGGRGIRADEVALLVR